ncbi:hypothetical protein [Streptomyces hokutonensis]|uniref:hypothetical protein n=1 Tax=Streptomyces hokutonensis TaxID=1306990 RepID=UPI0038207073
MEHTYLEYPTAQDLLPFMGLHVVALPADRPLWGGTLIGISDKAHIRKESGQIAEFPLDETVFKCMRNEGCSGGKSAGSRDVGCQSSITSTKPDTATMAADARRTASHPSRLLEREYFEFLGFIWDITKAQEIAGTLPVRRVDPQPWFQLLGAIGLNEAHIPHVDLRRPLILAPIREAGGAVLIIDGWHRLARAQREGVTDVPAVLLDEKQEFEVRIFGGRKPGRAVPPSVPQTRASTDSYDALGPERGTGDRRS